MKKITLLAALLSLGMAWSQTITIKANSFEEPGAPGGSYTDLGDATMAHDLVNNTGEPLVDFTSTGGEIGFDASYVPYDTPGVGLTDGDFVGVTDFTGDVTAYTDGVQGYQLSDVDGNMIVEFDIVDFAGFINNSVSIDYFVNGTGYEGDGTLNESGSDRMRIYVRDLTNATEINILNTEGSDINDLMIEDSWITGTVSVPDNITAQLVVEVRTNAGSEALYLDNVLFEGEETIPLVEVEFQDSFASISEDDNSIEITVTPSAAPAQTATVDVVLIQGGTAVEGTHFNYATAETLTFPAGISTSQSITIPVTDNTSDTSDLFFVLELQNETNTVIGANNLFSVYILDDDTEVPAGDDSELNINFLSSYLVDAAGTAEISAFDATSQQLFVTNDDKIEVLDFSDPDNIFSLATVFVSDFGADAVQSIATDGNGLVAAALSVDPATDAGIVIISDTDGNSPVGVFVGSLPDMLTFTPDGSKIVVANEGEPNDDYSIDPEGTISVIDVSGGLGNISQSDVTTLDFNAFDSQQAALEAAGVRIYGPGATVSQDLEPEYIAVSSDSQKAYVTLQENNAYAIVDLVALEITDVISFGLKDHSQLPNSLDLSDETDFIFDATWPVKGMYMPDAIAFYEVDGVSYIVTANEGDAREYDTYEEERKIDDSDYVLDAGIFSNIDILELETNLAEINVTNASGDIDNDGEFEEIHVFGGRSFSIFNADTGALVYDSGNDFEVITAADPVYGAIFNASNSNNNLKNRSDNKGPEPEGVIVQEIQGETYAFVLLERIGGVMVYNITDPANPVFLEYENSRDATPGGPEMGDLGPEGVVYIAPEDNSTEKGLLVISNEVSATLSIYSIENDIILGVNDFEVAENGFAMYPNPTEDRIFFSEPGSYRLYDLGGRLIKQVNDAASLEVATLSSGTYFITNTTGITRKLIIK
ncbi:MAG: choice-of-anchor I family protein [Bacteroidota bacterium]